jgi:hypothetical protein
MSKQNCNVDYLEFVCKNDVNKIIFIENKQIKEDTTLSFKIGNFHTLQYFKNENEVIKFQNIGGIIKTIVPKLKGINTILSFDSNCNENIPDKSSGKKLQPNKPSIRVKVEALK